MSVWETLGNTQNTLGKSGKISTVPGVSAARIPFSTGFEIASNLPNNPGGWNDGLETARQKGIELATYNPILTGAALGAIGGLPGAAIGAASGAAVIGLDKVTDGGASKLLQAGAKNLRSNYAFIRDVSDKNAAMGMFAGLTMIAGGVLGGIAGFAVGGPAGAFVGAGIGANLAGKAERDVLKSDLGRSISRQLNASAKFASSSAGQEQYNFGNDVVHTVAKVKGFQTIGDNTKGIGAIVSGAINFGVEATFGLDILAAKGAGIARKGLLVKPIVEPMGPISRKIFSSSEADRVANRLVADIDMIKRTVAGEKTPYTDVFNFYKNSDASELIKRPEFDNEIGHIAAHLFAGADIETSALLTRVGRQDPTALSELAAKHADKFAEMTRYQDALKIVEKDGFTYLSYKGDTLPMSKMFKNNSDMVKAEIEALKPQVQWLSDALSIEGGMKNRTVARWAVIERIRNDIAKINAEKDIRTGKVSQMETGIGKTYQWIYQKSPLSKPIRVIDRATSDAPRSIINFNDPLIANARMQASLRSAEKLKASIPVNNAKVMNDFINARTEIDKMNVIESYASNGIKTLAAKYNISPDIIDYVVDKYISTHRLAKNEAKLAQEEKRGYMNNPHDPEGPLISDPQLITQLANGSHLPDWVFFDKVLKEFSKKHGAKASMPIKTAEGVKFIADELNSMWRGFTLLRGGYPVNVVRDSYIRGWGDAVLFDMFKHLSIDTIDAVLNTGNTVARINRRAKGIIDKNFNLKSIREEINAREAVLAQYDKALKNAGYDVKKPPKTVEEKFAKNLEIRQNILNSLTTLRDHERTVISGIKDKRVSRKTINVDGQEFSAAFGGRFGEISKQAIAQKDDLRRAIAGVRELEIETVRRSRKGSRSITPNEEAKHLMSWEQILNDKMRFDPAARLILEGKSRLEVIRWLRDPKNFSYLDRFGESAADASAAYSRIKTFVDSYAPSAELRKLILTDKLDAVALKKLYPNPQERPIVFTDLADDMLGTSLATKNYRQILKDSVAWLSTKPTAFLAFNPYFAAKYEEEIQSRIWLANANGIDLGKAGAKEKIEAGARAYALKEYKEKLNSFHRDMNYSGIINYLFAFFPALVEQFRAYGKIMLDHPDFAIKKVKIANIPNQLGQVQTDQFGNEFVEVDLPYLGLKGRLPTSWFNPDNPTGGSLLSISPMGSALVNEYAKRTNIENDFINMVLPFGVQKNSLNAMKPTTVRRAWDVFNARFTKSGDQFNKDTDMFIKQLWNEHLKETHKQPNGTEYSDIFKKAQDRAYQLAILRFMSATTLPLQPRYVTPLAHHQDIYSQYVSKYGQQADELFSQDYPDYFMLADSLTDPTSGVNADRTSAYLVKKNKDRIPNLLAGIGFDNLTVLGAVFNDENYAFSSAANAYLQDTKIPGTNKKFRDVSDAFANSRSAIVSKGWNDLFKMQEIVSDELKRGKPPIDPNVGYGAEIMKKFKESFVNAQKEQNKMWWDEYQAGSFGGKGSRQADVVTVLTRAANDDKLWSYLEKQPRWGMIVDYLNFRYDVYDQLQKMGTTIDSKKAGWVRDNVEKVVSQMKAKDVNFGKFYDRYFSQDKFDFVYEGE